MSGTNSDTLADHLNKRCWPIIYVRGFAGSENEIEDTVADPYMGFNIGSTKFRQAVSGTVRRHYFESPLYRLVKDFGYSDVYTDGLYMPLGKPVRPRSVVVYRYYDDQFFSELDQEDDALPPIEIDAAPREIEDFAAGLGKLILKVRQRLIQDDPSIEKDFKVYLVGHSMGGLIIRTFLQFVGHGGKKIKDRYGKWEARFKEAKSYVDKVFTYATPHNGIELSIIGNVPSFFTKNDVDNFNRDRMRDYLDLPAWSVDRADNLLDRFDASRFFSLVGTNHQDYAVLYGWSRRLVGPMSDGLVRIPNASVCSQKTLTSEKTEGPRAYVNRSHSGHFGIVNSEEGYQNLVRFLFGDVRIEGIFEVEKLTLPDAIEELKKAGKTVSASYHFEVAVRIRGIDCDLHRRRCDDASAVFRKYEDLFPAKGIAPRNPHLFTLFLSSHSRVKKDRPTLGFAIELGVRVPEYIVERRLWLDQHYEGSYLLRETIYLEATPPQGDSGKWAVRYGSDPFKLADSGTAAALQTDNDGVMFEIPIDSKSKPGITGKLKLTAYPWE